MSEEAQSPVPMIVVIAIAVISLLFGLISLCMGGIGVISGGLLATLASVSTGDLQLPMILPYVLEIVDLLACLVLAGGAVVALINRSKGRFALVGALVLLLASDWILFLGGLGISVYFYGEALTGPPVRCAVLVTPADHSQPWPIHLPRTPIFTETPG